MAEKVLLFFLQDFNDFGRILTRYGIRLYIYDGMI